MIICLLLWQLRVANENEERLRADCMKYKEVLESRSSAVAVSIRVVVVCCYYKMVTSCRGYNILLKVNVLCLYRRKLQWEFDLMKSAPDTILKFNLTLLCRFQ